MSAARATSMDCTTCAAQSAPEPWFPTAILAAASAAAITRWPCARRSAPSWSASSTGVGCPGDSRAITAMRSAHARGVSKKSAAAKPRRATRTPGSLAAQGGGRYDKGDGGGPVSRRDASRNRRHGRGLESDRPGRRRGAEAPSSARRSQPFACSGFRTRRTPPVTAPASERDRDPGGGPRRKGARVSFWSMSREPICGCSRPLWLLSE